ncbi:transposase [Streptomyces sp. NPDC007872]|uniref:IS701 family transposase n=1 Tax=Streptomyces sp. NPDC007872 TaxID=3364782 RepID=UPI003686E735
MSVLYERSPRALADPGAYRRPAEDAYRRTDDSFAEAVFGRLPRADQRRWAELYVKALLQTPGKKSVRRLADSVSHSPTASQSMHQFVNASPWDWHAVRQDLLRRVERTTAATAWTLAPAFIPKRGEHSVGVHRRFDPFLGKVVTCQLGIGLFLSGDAGLLPVDWALYVPEDWGADSARRARARVPDDVGGAMWSQAAELVDRAASWTTGPRVPLTADLSWMPDHHALLAHAVRDEQQPFVVEVPETLSVRPVSASPAESGFLTVRRLLAARGGAPSGGEQHHGLDILSLPVALPGRTARQPRLRMLVQRQAGGGARVWLTNLTDRPLPQLLPLMRQPRLAAAVVNSLSGDFGLQDFEGRSFPGWHHHATLVSAAFVQYRLRDRAPVAGHV